MNVSFGWLDGNFTRYLNDAEYKLYEKTYPIVDYNEIWKVLNKVVELYHNAGTAVADYFGYIYPEQAENDMLQQLIENVKKE